MKDEKTSWQEWYEENPRPRKKLLSKLTHGIGVNDLPYVVKFVNKQTKPWTILYTCRFYTAWERMIRRSYQKKWADKYPTYKEVSVSEEFLSAKYFSIWMATQITTEGEETLQLDKDILYPGNKVYSPSTCVFVPQFLNMSVNICERASGNLPKGVKSYTLKSGEVRYGWSVHNTSSKFGESGFVCKWVAHKEWQLARASVIDAAIDKYRNMVCYREDVAYAVKTRADKLRYDAKFGLETTRLP